MTDEFDDEPGFPYLAFCPISIYDPANHDPQNCPYCGEANGLTDEDINRLINGDWTPGQVESFERTHEGLIKTIYVPANKRLECRCVHGCAVRLVVIPYVATPKALGECEHFRYVMLLEDEDASESRSEPSERAAKGNNDGDK